MIKKPVSLAGQIFDTLEKDILTGKLQRGSILTETEISSMLGVSRTPVREAISRLAQENMVEETNKGILIMGITDKDADCIYEIREKLEAMIAREAALEVTDEELKEMRDLIDYHEFCLSKGDIEKIHECDDEFHEIFYRASGNSVLYNTCIPLHRKIKRYRRLSVTDPERALQSKEEHEAIYSALVEHDPDKAEKAILTHIENARKSAKKNDDKGETK